MTDRLSTGVEEIDRQLDGGLFPGSIVAICAPPTGQSEPLLYATMRERQTQYISTRHDETAIQDILDRVFRGTVDYDLEVVGPTAPHEGIRDVIDVPEGGAVIIDTVDPLEHASSRDEYATFLNEVKTAVVEAEGVALLHCSTGTDARLRTFTESFADVIWDLSIERSGSDLNAYLEIPKFRGDELPGEVITLELGREVDVDTSRDIA